MKRAPFLFLMLMVVSHAHANFLTSALAQKVQTGTSVQEDFFTHHVLIFFFSSRCSYCQQFAPIIKQWSRAHGASILALSFDNQALPSLSDFMPVTTEWINKAYADQAITYPALFIANQRSHQLYPVAFGAMDAQALEQRLTDIKAKIVRYEARGHLL
jgi:type-F conjugative transfer system pilin assembly thiol-disulfide isomerase TrbB